MADALFHRVRQRALALLYGNPDRSFFSNEIVALAQSGTGAVQPELASLSGSGLLTVTAQGNQKHYQANKAAAVFAELRGLVLKTSGVVDVLRNALAPLASGIDAAFVYGSVAKQQDTSSGRANRCGSSGERLVVDLIIAVKNVADALAASPVAGASAEERKHRPRTSARRLKPPCTARAGG